MSIVRPWTYTLFDCHRQSLHLNACSFCPLTAPCVLANIAAKIRYYPCACGFTSFLALASLFYYANYGVGIAMDFVTSRTTDLILAGVGALFAVAIAGTVAVVRHHFRRKLLIAGTDADDCVSAACCSCCSLVQMAGEAGLEEISVISEPSEYAAAPPRL